MLEIGSVSQKSFASFSRWLSTHRLQTIAIVPFFVSLLLRLAGSAGIVPAETVNKILIYSGLYFLAPR